MIGHILVLQLPEDMYGSDMAQITFYIDDDLRDRIVAAADRAGISVSKWISARLRTALEDEWPDGYFELFGSLAEEGLERPAQPPLDDAGPIDPG